MQEIPIELKNSDTKVFQFTEYFNKSRNKPGHVDQVTALEAVSKAIFYEEQVIDREKRHCIIGMSDKFLGKYIRVILLEDFGTIHNAFFDRSAKKMIQTKGTK